MFLQTTVVSQAFCLSTENKNPIQKTNQEAQKRLNTVDEKKLKNLTNTAICHRI